MSVSNGQNANQTTFNNAFVSRTVDTSTAGKLDLINADTTNSGPSIVNAQREHNSIASWVGKAINAVKDLIPTWVNTNVGTGSDDLYTRAEALTLKFANIQASEINSVPLKGFEKVGIDLVAVTGSSTDVTTEMTGSSPSTVVTQLGVVVNAPYNKVYLAETSTYNPFEDSLGNRVYGRITESTGTWTLTYYSLVAGVETSYSFSSSNVSWWYQELFNPIGSSAPVYSEAFVMPSDNATNDIVDASASARGAVSTADQTFAGIKRFLNQLAIRDTSAAFDVVVAFVSSVALTVQRTLTLDMKNANRTLTMSGDADISGTNTGDQTITLTGDATGSGTGSFATTIANNAVTNAKAAQMAAHTFKGNNTGSTANAIDLTATQLTAELNNFIGDSGSGGTKGLVVAPATGDATKFLRGDATWQTVSGGSGGFNYTAQTSAYTAIAQDYVNCTSGTFTVSLPTASGVAGKMIKVRNSGSGVILVGTINVYLSNSGEEITLVSDNSAWIVDSYIFKQSTVVYSTGAAGTDTSAVGSFPWVRINLSPTLTGGADITAAQDGTNGCQFTAQYAGWMTVNWGVDQPAGAGSRVAVNGTVYENIYGSMNGGSTEHSVGSIKLKVAANDTIQIGVSSATVNGVSSTTFISATLEKELF